MKEILLTSSVLIVVILLARLLFRGKVSQRLIYAAWLLVALRLLIPIQFGQSQYSITTLTEKIENNSKPIQQVQEAMDEPVAGPSREELYDQLVNEYIQQIPTPDLPEIRESITPEVQEQIEEQVEQRINVPTLSELLTTIWIVGMSAMAAWFITANVIYLRRAKQGAVPLSEIDAPIPVRISPPCAHTLSGGLLPPGDLHDPCQRRKRTNKKGNLVQTISRGNHMRNFKYTYENGVLTGIEHIVEYFPDDQETYKMDGHGNVACVSWADGSRTEFKYVAVELPDEFADRVLRYRHVSGMASTVDAYYRRYCAVFFAIYQAASDLY